MTRLNPNKITTRATVGRTDDQDEHCCCSYRMHMPRLSSGFSSLLPGPNCTRITNGVVLPAIKQIGNVLPISRVRGFAVDNFPNGHIYK